MSTSRTRPAQVGDLSALARIEHEAFGTGAYSTMTFRQFLDIAGPLFVVADPGDGVAGYALALPAITGSVCFMSLAVSQRWRRYGLGRELFGEIVATFDTLPYSSIWLTTKPDNASILRLCESFDFTEEETKQDYFGPAEDRLLMTRAARTGSHFSTAGSRRGRR